VPAIEYSGAFERPSTFTPHEERHAAEGTVAQTGLIEPADAVVIGLDDGVHLGIDRFDRARRRRRQLLRRNVPLAHQLGQAEAVVRRVLSEIHDSPHAAPQFFARGLDGRAVVSSAT
jgi:hypothetical protein